MGLQGEFFYGFPSLICPFFPVFLSTKAGWAGWEKAKSSEGKIALHPKNFKRFRMLNITSWVGHYKGGVPRGRPQACFASSFPDSGSEKSVIPLSNKRLYHWITFLMSLGYTRSSS